MHYLILGNGAAGTYGAKAIQEQDKDGEITIITEESYPFYYRPRLPEVVAGELTPREIEAMAADWYEANKVRLLLRERIKVIDTTAKTVSTATGSHSYDRLLIALGSSPQFPPIAGLDLEGVYSLRTADDALTLRKLGTTHKKAVLIGGGLLGLEAAYGLIRLGAVVTVVEFFDRLLPRQMDKEGAALLQARLEKMGFNFRIGVATESVSGTLGKMTLRFKNSEPLEGEFVLVSAGIKPNTEVPEQTRIECDRGVKVNARMETNVRDVYAAGDVAQFEGRVYGIWPAAMEQGRVAGNNMAGGDMTYAGTLPSTTLKVAGIDLSSFGRIADFAEEVKEYKRIDKEALTYAKIFVLPGGRLVGGIFLGETALGRQVQALLKKGIDVSGYEEKLLAPDFDFSSLN